MEAKPNGYLSELKNELLKGVVVPELSGFREQCIYKVPPRLRQVNPEAYTPQVISIGPFHRSHGDNILHQMEPLKLNYLKGFLNRTKLSLDDFDFDSQEWENRIRSCYGGLFSFNSNEFLKIIIVDACFIIEHFLRFYEYSNWERNDPILLQPWLLDDIKRDLVLLENQLPFFVLEYIYRLAGLNRGSPSFFDITSIYFQPMDRNLHNLTSHRMLSPYHFTDLVRAFLLPSSFFVHETGCSIENVYSVSQLSEAGLVCEVNEGKYLLDLSFDEGVLKMPCLHVHHTTESYLRNILAYEECHISNLNTRYISQYLTILGFLINSEKDVSILIDKKIIVNWMGDANDVATMVNNLRKNVSMPPFRLQYKSVCERLNGFYENPMNKHKAILVHEYFNTPWKIASTVAAVVLLLLTLIQTICSIVSL
ncbi:unnamed protein product [Lathyrus sativus]|nr:unnamed protein product [Lathyrus sativus]